MLKVMIVDDEISVRDGLRDLIEWNSLGYTVVATASDGVEALENYKKYLPDVIITDICMTNKNGLEFLTDVKKINSNTEFIMLTGYPNFDYIKFSFDHDTAAYLLKPLKIDELLSALLKIRRKLYQRCFDNRANVLQFLIQSPNQKISDINTLFKKHGIKPPNSSYYVMSIRLNSPDTLLSDSEYTELTEKINIIFMPQHEYLLCRPNSKYLSILMFCNNTNLQPSICSTITNITLSSQSDLSISIGVSETTDDITLIQDMYFQSLFALFNTKDENACVKYYTGLSGKLFDKILTTSRFLSAKDLVQIFNGISSSNQILVNRVIDDFFNSLTTINHLNWNVIRNNVSDFAVQLIHYVASNEKEAVEIFGRVPNPIIEIQNISVLQDLYEYIMVLVNSIFTHIQSLPNRNYSKLVNDVKAYITVNYHSPISINDIAHQLLTERSSLMKSFKSETGMTINEYLTNYRMSIALDLIKSNKFQVQEIAAMVGYIDPKYFSKVFKKTFNCLPSEYCE